MGTARVLVEIGKIKTFLFKLGRTLGISSLEFQHSLGFLQNSLSSGVKNGRNHQNQDFSFSNWAKLLESLAPNFSIVSIFCFFFSGVKNSGIHKNQDYFRVHSDENKRGTHLELRMWALPTFSSKSFLKLMSKMVEKSKFNTFPFQIGPQPWNLYSLGFKGRPPFLQNSL